MKRMFVAAGALLLGTSALAYAGSMDKPIDASTGVKLSTSSNFDKSLTSTDSIYSNWDKARMASWEKTLAPSKTDTAMADDAKFSFASLDKDLQPLASDESGAKLMTASAE